MSSDRELCQCVCVCVGGGSKYVNVVHVCMSVYVICCNNYS